MKKVKILVCVLLALLFILPTFMASASAASFSDDFSSGNLNQWTNAELDGDSGTKDLECVGQASAQDGVLQFDSFSDVHTFFYMAPKDFTIKDFVCTFKAKTSDFKDGWLGISFRKDVNDRFNACNNIMVYYRFGSTNNYISTQAMRGYTGTSTVTLTPTAGAPISGVSDQWVNIKLCVNGTVFNAYANGTLIGSFTYAKLNTDGMISLNQCGFKGAIDDFSVVPYSADLDKPDSGDSETSDPVNSDPSDSSASVSSSSPADSSTDSIDSSSPSSSSASVDSNSSGSTDAGYIKPIYADVSVNETSGVITLSMPLKVSELQTSFRLSDGYTMTVVDASGATVSDKETTITTDMMAVVKKGDTVVKTFSIAITPTTSSDASSVSTGSSSADNGIGGMGIALIVIVAVIVLGGAGAAVYFFVIKKKA